MRDAQDIAHDTLSPEDYCAWLTATHYRWWTVSYSRDHVKIGPVSLSWYRWFDQRLRISLHVKNGRERMLYGGPLR